MVSCDHAEGNLAVKAREGGLCDLPFLSGIPTALDDISNMGDKDDLFANRICSNPRRLSVKRFWKLLCVVLRVREDRYGEVTLNAARCSCTSRLLHEELLLSSDI